MAKSNGIVKIQSTATEIKGKEVKVVGGNFIDEEGGEIISPYEILAAFDGQYVNFSFKVTDKIEDKFETKSDVYDDGIEDEVEDEE